MCNSTVAWRPKTDMPHNIVHTSLNFAMESFWCFFLRFNILNQTKQNVMVKKKPIKCKPATEIPLQRVKTTGMDPLHGSSGPLLFNS